MIAKEIRGLGVLHIDNIEQDTHHAMAVENNIQSKMSTLQDKTVKGKHKNNYNTFYFWKRVMANKEIYWARLTFQDRKSDNISF